MEGRGEREIARGRRPHVAGRDGPCRADRAEGRKREQMGDARGSVDHRDRVVRRGPHVRGRARRRAEAEGGARELRISLERG